MTKDTHSLAPNSMQVSIERLNSPSLAVEIIPELGARISSLRCPNGREWMWAPGLRRLLYRCEPKAGFLQSCMVGADECLPTIAACSVQGRSYPGHGECWSAPWSLDPRENEQSPVVTHLHLPLSNAVFRRAASLHGNTLLLEYEVTNGTDEPWDFTYAFHPLFPMEPGDHVSLPIRQGGEILVENWSGKRAPWPSPVPGADLSCFQMGDISPSTLKIFTADPLTDHRAIVSNAITRERLTVDFDPSFFPALGFYVNQNGWGAHRHFAIEPTNAQADSLEECRRRGLHYSTLPPRASVRWWIQITVEAGIDEPGGGR